MPNLRRILRVVALVLVGLTVALWLPPLVRLTQQESPARLETTDGGAEIRLSVSQQIVPFDASCTLAEWQVEGIRTVAVNGQAAIGAGQQVVCGESARLAVVLQDGTPREYRIQRVVTFPTPLRALAVVAVLTMLAAFVPWRLPSAARPMARTFRRWMRAETRYNRVALVIITLFGLALRLLHLNGPVKQDEVITFFHYASHSTWDAISLYYSTNNHVFHTLLMNLSYTLLGNQPWVLRLPVFFAGVLLVPAVYVAGRALYSSSSGLLAAAFVAASSVLAVFSTYGRGYMIQALLAVLMLNLALYALRRRDAFAWVLYGVCVALGFYTSASMIYPFAVISAWLGLVLLGRSLRQRSPRPPLPWLAATVGGIAGAALLHVPVFIVSGLDAFLGNEYVIPQSVEQFAAQLPDSLSSVWRGAMQDIPALLVAALVAGFALSVLFSRRLSGFRLPLGLVGLVVIPPIMFALRVPIYERVMIPIFPLFFIVACGGVAGFPRRSGRGAAWGISALAVALTANVLAANAVHRAEHWAMGAFQEAPEVLPVVFSRLEAGDRIIVHRRETVMSYYALLYDLGSEYVTTPRNPDSVPRVYVIAPWPSQPPDKVLTEFGYDPDNLSQPELLGHYGGYALYLVERGESAVQSS